MAAPKQGGFKMSLGGLKGKVGLKALPAQKDAKRPRLALGDDEEDDSGKQQEISGWDAAEGGAVDISGPKAKETPRVIPALPNRNWRDEARRKQLAKAPHVQAQNGTVVEHIEEPKVQYGLTILKKEKPQDNDGQEAAETAEPIEDVQDNLTEEQRLEKKALDSLLSGRSADDDFVIPIQSEEEALRNELRAAPDVPTLDAHEATPIEGFGAAMLRGMGWKGDDANGDGTTTKPKEVKRRPALLGIGAKAEAAEGVELGEWGGTKGKGKGKKKLVETYNPITLRNKVTGELITEDELKAKMEQQDMVQDEKPANERRKYSDNDEDERRREKRRDRRDDRDRDYDSERRRDRDRKDDRYDSDRRRDKRKDKYRDEDYDSERRRDKGKDRERRDRSRSPDGDRHEKKRDRYRSRSRDARKDGGRRDRSRDSDDRRKRRREKEYDDDREDRKRRHKDDKY